jgi:mycothiol system anti-sigma-R factor
MDCQKIDCQKIREYLYPFIDGELDEQKIASIKDHLSKCPLCKLEVKNEQEADAIFRSCFPQETASYELKEKILQRVREEAGKAPSLRISSILKPAVAVAAVLVVAYFAFTSRTSEAMYENAVNDHMRLVQSGAAPDIRASVPDELMRQLQGRVSFSILVPDLSAQGAELKGACLCRLTDKGSAHIIYEKAGHTISAFLFPAKGIKMSGAKKVVLDNCEFFLQSHKGCNGISWCSRGIGCFVTSDLDETELVYLVKAMSQQH